MDDNTIEIRDAEINVEEIMAKIRENIRRRQAAGELPLDPDSIITSTSKNATINTFSDTIGRDLSYINTNWDIHNTSYFISSHRPYIGKILVKGRQLVNGEIRRYMDPVISRQTEFNASTVRILVETSQKFDEMNLKISQQGEELNKNFSGLKEVLSQKISLQEQELIQKFSRESDIVSQKISLQEQELIRKFSQESDRVSQKISQQEQELIRKFSRESDILSQKISQLEQELIRKFSRHEEELAANIQIRIDKNFNEVISNVDKDLRLQVGLVHVLEERIQKGLAQKITPKESISPQLTNYFLFEERFRGTRENIKQRQQAFLPYFEKCSRVLDIGCGRGEFLEILRNHNIGGMGVDIDADMVAYCHSRHLEVEQSDALIYLETLEDKSLDGIFIDQVVEHLEPGYLIRLLALCYQKMKFGYHIVVETVNPLSFVSFVNFYIDMTHKRPVHPETLQYLICASGFRECEKKFFSPVSDEGRLKKIENISLPDEAFQKNVEIYNHNTELLNTVLFGAQDYAIIGKK